MLTKDKKVVIIVGVVYQFTEPWGGDYHEEDYRFEWEDKFDTIEKCLTEIKKHYRIYHYEERKDKIIIWVI